MNCNSMSSNADNIYLLQTICSYHNQNNFCLLPSQKYTPNFRKIRKSYDFCFTELKVEGSPPFTFRTKISRAIFYFLYLFMPKPNFTDKIAPHKKPPQGS